MPLQLDEFPDIVLGAHTRHIMRVRVLPDTYWEIEVRGPGTCRKRELEAALNFRCEGVGDLRGTRGEIVYDCIRGTVEGTVTREAEYIDASTWPDMRAPLDPRVHDVDRAHAQALAEERARQESLAFERACVKAHQSLVRMLTPEQRADLERHNYFYITGSKGTRYRLSTTNYSYNVHWVDKRNESRGRFCAHPDLNARDLDGKKGTLPIYDSVIAQKLMLETDEQKFLMIANKSGGNYPPGVMSPAFLLARFREAGIPDPACGCQACNEARDLQRTMAQ